MMDRDAGGGGCTSVEEFIMSNGIDERAADSLRSSSPAVQQGVLAKGDLSSAANPSSALMVRLREVKSGGGCGDQFMPSGGGCTNVEEFIMASGIDERAAEALRCSSPAVQQGVLARGDLSTAANPSSALMVRISAVGKGFTNMSNNTLGAGTKRKHDGDWGGVMGGGPFMGQMGAMMMGNFDGCGGYPNMGQFMLPCGCGGFANVGQFMPPGGGCANVEEFILSSGVDERAADALRAESPAVQQGVLAKGPVSNAQNPSSALMVRIKEAKSGPLMAQMQMGAMMMGNFGGCGGYANAGQFMPQVGGCGNVEAFILSNGIDDRAAGALRQESPAVQQGVLAKGDLSSAQNPSSALMVRLKEVKSGGCSGFANAGQFMPSFGGCANVEAFIMSNGLDERAASALRQESPAVQQGVLANGDLSNYQNPSSAVMARLRDVKSSGCGGFTNAEQFMSPGSGCTDVEQFIMSSGIDERAAGALREESPAVQQGVLAKGDLSNAQNPSSAVMVRIKDAKKMRSY